MFNKYSKNSIISFILIVSTIFAPLAFLPTKTNAQGITTYISGSSNVITQLPLCQNKLNNVFSNIFNGTKGVDYGNKSTTDPTSDFFIGPLQETSVDTLESSVTDDSWMSESIPVELPTKVKEDIAKTLKMSTETKDKVTSIDNQDTCLKSIGRVVIKMLLQKITLSTVDWINNGYEGSPMFIQNPGDFFKDLAMDEMLQFSSEINNPALYPFGKDYLKSMANSYNNKFATNAQYSLDKVIRSTNPMYNAATFNSDFSQGGWAAWDAMTQNPANNPLGFALMASNELAKRIEEKTALSSGSLQQSGGYLGVEKCISPEGVTYEDHKEALKERASSEMGPYQHELCEKWTTVTPGKMVADAATTAVNYPTNNLLKADDLNDAVAAILDAMLAKYSNGIMEKNGFFGLSQSDSWQDASEGKFIINDSNKEDYSNFKDFPGYQIAGSSFLRNNPNFNIRTDLNQALVDEQRIFIDKLKEQNKELKSNDGTTIPSATNGYFTGNYGLIPTIYQLDYCIPGPHPGWENDSRNVLNAVMGTVVPETEESLKSRKSESIKGLVTTGASLAAAAAGAAIGASIGSGVPVIGTIIGAALGALIGWAINAIVDVSEERKLVIYYSGIVASMTGIRLNDEVTKNKRDETTNNLYSKQKVEGVMNKILDRYIELAHNFYKQENMPSVTDEAYTKFKQVKGYNKMYENNEKRIVSMNSVARRLAEIKIKIEKLNRELKDKQIKYRNGEIAQEYTTYDTDGNIEKLGQQDQYEENLKPWISAFGRLSAEMVNGDDIAIIDNRIKQIITEKDYIYNNLLKGPNGCEKEVMLEKSGGWPVLHWKFYDTKRMEYPGELLYDYNMFKNNEELPDPYKSGNINKTIGKWPGTNQNIPFNNVGPGFLSWISFEDKKTWCSIPFNSPIQTPDGEVSSYEIIQNKDKSYIGCLKINDLLPTRYGQFQPLGIVNSNWLKKPNEQGYEPHDDGIQRNGMYEGMMGIY